MNSEQQILLEGATSDLVESVVRYEGVAMSDAFDLVYNSKLHKKMEDPLTGLYNRDFFFQYANRMYRDHHDTPMDAIVLNIDQFHSVNMLNGRDFGDQVLRLLGDEISLIAKEYGRHRRQIRSGPLRHLLQAYGGLPGYL